MEPSEFIEKYEADISKNEAFKTSVTEVLEKQSTEIEKLKTALVESRIEVEKLEEKISLLEAEDSTETEAEEDDDEDEDKEDKGEDKEEPLEDDNDSKDSKKAKKPKVESAAIPAVSVEQTEVKTFAEDATELINNYFN